MIQIRSSPGPQLRAQLVGLGMSPYPALRNVSPIPPALQQSIQEAAAGPSTGNGSGATDTGGLLPDPSTTAAPPAGTNWLLWGGVGVGVLLLGLLIIRR